MHQVGDNHFVHHVRRPKLNCASSIQPLVISSEAGDLGFCPHRVCRRLRQTPGSLALLGMTTREDYGHCEASTPTANSGLPEALPRSTAAAADPTAPPPPRAAAPAQTDRPAAGC